LDPRALAARLHAVRQRITEAAERSGRDPASIELVAVSKGQPAEAVAAAYEAGQRAFGENYVQELVAKAAALADRGALAWHAIGSLQRNKARDVARVASVIHSIDREDLARELDRRASALGRRPRVFLEVNVAREASKGGCAPEGLAALLATIRGCTSLDPVGLMAIVPEVEQPEHARPYFAALRRLGHEHFGPSSALSMGMSHDFEIAIEEGATVVRVGTAIFGPRSSSL
jgi:pyridoxal phosphate enzyme (YggS family)